MLPSDTTQRDLSKERVPGVNALQKPMVFTIQNFMARSRNMAKTVKNHERKSTKQGSGDKLRTRDRHQPILHEEKHLFTPFLTPASTRLRPGMARKSGSS